MTDTHPTLPALIQNNLSDAMNKLTDHVKTFHVDGEVTCAGYLRNGKGAKILISNLEEMCDEDIQTWIHHCRSSGAINVNYTADFGSGFLELYPSWALDSHYIGFVPKAEEAWPLEVLQQEAKTLFLHGTLQLPGFSGPF